MSSAGRFNITIEQGATFTMTAQYVAPDGTTPIDMTGWTARAQIRRRTADTTPIVALALGSGITIDIPSGTITLTVDDETTAGLTPGSAVWDLLLESSADVAVRLLEGTVTITPAVTR